MNWQRIQRGWWEAEGDRYNYRAIQAASQRWELYVYLDGALEAEATYPITLADCRYYAGQLEKGRYEVQGGRLIPPASTAAGDRAERERAR